VSSWSNFPLVRCFFGVLMVASVYKFCLKKEMEVHIIFHVIYFCRKKAATMFRMVAEQDSPLHHSQILLIFLMVA
jgi:hypothetical protein